MPGLFAMVDGWWTDRHVDGQSMDDIHNKGEKGMWTHVLSCRLPKSGQNTPSSCDMANLS